MRLVRTNGRNSLKSIRSERRSHFKDSRKGGNKLGWYLQGRKPLSVSPGASIIMIRCFLWQYFRLFVPFMCLPNSHSGKSIPCLSFKVISSAGSSCCSYSCTQCPSRSLSCANHTNPRDLPKLPKVLCRVTRPALRASISYIRRRKDCLRRQARPFPPNQRSH